MTALSTRSDAPDIGEATYPRPAIDDGRLVEMGHDGAMRVADTGVELRPL